MAAGSRTNYALDLNDIFAFPDGDNIPLRPPDSKNGESWVMLLEVGLLSFAVTHGLSLREKIMGFPTSRLTYATIDITGKWFDVVINTSNPFFDTVDYERGQTMCILNAEPLFRADGQFYYRVDDISTVEVRSSSFTCLTYDGHPCSAASRLIG